MTFPDALKMSLPGTDQTDHKSIRRASWLSGHKIRWSQKAGMWVFGNRFDPDGLPIIDRHRRLDLEQMQGCLTPETMLADDWEVLQ